MDRVPPNLKFLIDDFEDEWIDDEFDFIHARYLAGSVKDFPKLLRQAYELSDFSSDCRILLTPVDILLPEDGWNSRTGMLLYTHKMGQQKVHP